MGTSAVRIAGAKVRQSTRTSSQQGAAGSAAWQKQLQQRCDIAAAKLPATATRKRWPWRIAVAPPPHDASIVHELRYAIAASEFTLVGIAKFSGVSRASIERFMVEPGKPGHRDIPFADAARIAEFLGQRIFPRWMIRDLVRKAKRGGQL